MSLGKDNKIKIGYKFGFGILMGLNRGPVDEVVHIKVGGKTAFNGSITTSTSVSINKPNLFGGDKGEGGVQGTLTVQMGEPDQPINPKLVSMLGNLVSAYRGVCTLFFDGWVATLNPYPKPWEVRQRRYSKGWDGDTWYPEKAKIVLTDPDTGGAIHAMNPAHIVYELETNRDWGRGKPRSRLDDASFRAAADRFYSEGFGLCLRWNRQDTIGNFAAAVMSHVGGSLYTSRTTGLRKLTLIRDDYDPASLPHFTPDTGLLDVIEDDNSTTADAVNVVKVTWRNPIDNSDRVARERNLAGIRSAGRPIMEDSNYKGLPTYALASRIAKRDLRAKSMAKRWKLVLDRRARDIEPGQPFKFSMPSRGLNNVVVRAGEINDEGKITITAVLDVFGLPATTFSAPVPNGWVPPNATPQTITTRRLVEATWRDLVQGIDPANLALVSSTAGYLRTLAVRPTSLSQNYDIQTKVGSGSWITKASGDFCPSALLVANLEPDGTTATLVSGVDLDLVDVGTAALVGNEICRVDSIDLNTNVVTFGRGCVDTVPERHLAGDRVWFIDDLVGTDPTAYTSSTSVSARLLTNTSEGQLDPALAGTDSLTIAARHDKPFPPGNLKINTLAWPTTATDDLVLTWAHRDRDLQADQLIDTTSASIGPELGTTYEAKIYNNGTNALVASHTGIAGTTDTILASELTGLSGVVLRLEVNSKRDGLASLYRQIRTFTWSATP